MQANNLVFAVPKGLAEWVAHLRSRFGLKNGLRIFAHACKLGPVPLSGLWPTFSRSAAKAVLRLNRAASAWEWISYGMTGT